MGSIKTSDVFKSGRPTYLRYSILSQEKMVVVECKGVSTSGTYLNVVWSDTQETSSTPPGEGTSLQVHSLLNGVLLVVPGVVEEVSIGRKPRIRIRVDQTCTAIQMRKHQRFQVVGHANLNHSDGNKSFSPGTDQSINISLGGFGLAVPNLDYEPGDEVSFSLELGSGEAESETGGMGTHQIAGKAIVRRVCPVDHSGDVLLGLEFSYISAVDKQKLEHLLAIHEAAQRLVKIKQSLSV